MKKLQIFSSKYKRELLSFASVLNISLFAFFLNGLSPRIIDDQELLRFYSQYALLNLVCLSLFGPIELLSSRIYATQTIDFKKSNIILHLNLIASLISTLLISFWNLFAHIPFGLLIASYFFIFAFGSFSYFRAINLGQNKFIFLALSSLAVLVFFTFSTLILINFVNFTAASLLSSVSGAYFVASVLFKNPIKNFQKISRELLRPNTIEKIKASIFSEYKYLVISGSLTLIPFNLPLVYLGHIESDAAKVASYASVLAIARGIFGISNSTSIVFTLKYTELFTDSTIGKRLRTFKLLFENSLPFLVSLIMSFFVILVSNVILFNLYLGEQLSITIPQIIAIFFGEFLLALTSVPRIALAALGESRLLIHVWFSSILISCTAYLFKLDALELAITLPISIGFLALSLSLYGYIKKSIKLD